MTHTEFDKGPIRTCVGCRRRDQQRAMVRIAREGATGHVAADLLRRWPGRGAYVHARAECLDANSVRVGLARSFRARVHNDDVRVLCAQLRGQSK